MSYSGISFSKRMKSTNNICLGVFACCLLAFMPTINAAFDDVKFSSEYGASILHLQEIGAVTGFADGSFRPTQNITRAEFSKILLLSKFSDEEILTCTDESFPDVAKDAWYFPYVCFAKTNEIVSGYDSGDFQPNAPISYAEAAKITVNVLIAATDQGSGDDWWTPFTTMLQKKNADPETVTMVTKPITRGEMALMISRVLRSNARLFSEERFEGKIVYTLNEQGTLADLQQHCATEGGTFNECGSPCEPNAEICVMMCAFTCDDIPAASATETTALIENRYANKIVYSLGSDESATRSHCVAEGGVFNSCGRQCESDADVCVAVCAPTCEDIDHTAAVAKKTAAFTFPNISGVTLSYPENTFSSVLPADNTITFSHSVPWEHPDACDFQGTGKQLDQLTDFAVSITAFNEEFAAVVSKHEPADFVSSHLTADKISLTEEPGFVDGVSVGELTGFKVTSGVEGCGEYRYYFPLNETLTLFVRRAFVAEFSDVFANHDTALRLPDILSPEQADMIFADIIASVKFSPKAE